MKSYLVVVSLLNNLLRLATERVRRLKALKREKKKNDIIKAPKKYHSDTFGESSGGVSIDDSESGD